MDELHMLPTTLEEAQKYGKRLTDIISETFPAFVMTLHHDSGNTKWGAWIFVGVEIFVEFTDFEITKLAEKVIETVRPHVEPMIRLDTTPPATGGDDDR